MTTPVMVPNGFQPVTDPMSLYSAATGMSATCNGTTIRPTIVRKTGSPAPPPAEHDGVGGEAGDSCYVGRSSWTPISREVLSASSTLPGASPEGTPPQRRGRPPGEEAP